MTHNTAHAAYIHGESHPSIVLSPNTCILCRLSRLTVDQMATADCALTACGRLAKDPAAPRKADDLEPLDSSLLRPDHSSHAIDAQSADMSIYGMRLRPCHDVLGLSFAVESYR